MKKWLLGILIACMVFSLIGCAATEPERTEGTAPSGGTEPTQEQQENPRLGTYQDGVYSNSFLGLECRVDEQWTVATEKELAELNGLVLDAMTDADLAAQLEKASVVHLFYAMADEGLVTMNVALENLGVINGVLLDEKSYVELSVKQVPAALEAIGLSGVTAEAEEMTFAGGSHWGVVIHGMLSDVNFYEKIVCVKVGNYLAAVTVGSYYEDITDQLLAKFTGI